MGAQRRRPHVPLTGQGRLHRGVARGPRSRSQDRVVDRAGDDDVESRPRHGAHDGRWPGRNRSGRIAGIQGARREARQQDAQEIAQRQGPRLAQRPPRQAHRLTALAPKEQSRRTRASNKHATSSMPRRAHRTARPRLGLALAGGGPLGGIYEVGALLALAESLEGIDVNELDVYVGVSSGSFVAAALANGISPAQMYRLFIDDGADATLAPALFLRPAFGEFARCALSAPRLFAGAALDFLRH